MRRWRSRFLLRLRLQRLCSIAFITEICLAVDEGDSLVAPTSTKQSGQDTVSASAQIGMLFA